MKERYIYLPYDTDMISPANHALANVRGVGWNWQVIPVTLAIITGPFITAAYRLTLTADAESGHFNLAQAIRGTLGLMMFLSLYLSRRLRLLEHAIIRPLVFLAIYTTLTAFLSPYPYENIVFAVKLAFVALVFASAFHLGQGNVCGESWLWGSAWVVLFLMATSQAIGLLTGRTVAVYSSDYATAGVMGAVSIAAVLIVSTVPVFLRFFPALWPAVFGIAVALISLFFTMRRTELIAASCAILLVMMRDLCLRKQNIAWTRTLTTVLLLSVLIMVGLQTQAGMDLLTRLSDMNPTKGTGSGRFIFWRISLNHIFNRSTDAQIFGEGMGSIRDVMYEHFGQSIGSHNTWLDLTHACGVFGLIAIAWWYFEQIRFANHLRTAKDPAFQGVFSAIVIFFLVSIGQGGSADPAFALTYAAFGLWAGQISYRDGGLLCPMYC